MKTVSADGLDLLSEDSRDMTAWNARIERDRKRAHAAQSDGMRQATELVLARSLAAGAEAVALTGSTARASRTAVSDLDLHVIGVRPSLDDLAFDVDVYATTPDVLLARLRAGDDYAQWTLRFGCVLFDTGVLRAAAAELVASAIWPSPSRKLRQVRRMLRLAEQVAVSGDHDAAVEQVRGVISGIARWRLLGIGAFPLSRPELPGQLRAVGDDETATMLERCIDGEPTLDELHAFVAAAKESIAGAVGVLVG